MKLYRHYQHFRIIGLATGSIAAYARPNRHITFFEIDPQVLGIAERFFSFLDRCGDKCNVIVADGRLAVVHQNHNEFDLLVIDAFNSDSIPPHLVSREALQIYLPKLKPDGVLLFHTSNRYLDIERLVVALLTDSGLTTFVRRDDDGNVIPRKSASDYVAGARRIQDLGSIAFNSNWKQMQRPADIQPWSDDYSNVLSLVR